MIALPQAEYATALYSLYTSAYKPNPSGPGNFMSLVLQTVAGLTQKYPATNKPTGDDIASTSVTSPAGTTAANLQTFLNGSGTPSTNVIMLGETHGNAADTARGNAAIAAISAAAPALSVNMVVFERGMSGTYAAPTAAGVNVVREENLTQPNANPNFWQGLSVAQRSIAVAGYLAACVAAGAQNTKNSILLLFGANHNDILSAFEQAVRQSGSYYVLKQARHYNFVQSNA
ncbi:hypothetical protein [Trinickia diaoshuihuensis]|jgi:hypothetical protein|uniref:hypothetical protein n=1 Tax=Trinickia diaoshuihuensis TaxID=2292265 RepID=UPI000E270598|nr:hypothetical protein [Trinickia diaoshuihuensis]